MNKIVVPQLLHTMIINELKVIVLFFGQLFKKI